ncbi:glycine zipper family protein [Corallococcus carmarthensis]|uniref:glycine zipper family protein n=1 Tax=Corallococcus carmarthensis TaxID=2316728 RepID=UPI0011C4302E|nr:glycine zipper family protein [Corallococcus carmarthensis]NOK22165.1 glycine zipper family protein [Corallococcus carmarthensis]
MPSAHVVNEIDGLSSLWLIAKHYRVQMVALEQRNSLIMSRFPPGHPRRGWLKVGDRVLLPLAQEEASAARQSKQSKNTLLDDNKWRAFFFVVVDETVTSGKVVRKVLEFPGPSQAQYALANPEIFGMRPPNPNAPFSLGEHALGHNQSRFLSASTHRGGAPNITGRPAYIDIKKATAAGVKIHSTEAILEDLAHLEKAHPDWRIRIDKLRKAIVMEGEVLMEGSVPASAIKRSHHAMTAARSLKAIQVIGLAFTVYDVGKATVKSVKQGSIKPITAEGIRQVGGWAAAVAGMKVGALTGAALGVETGPGAILTGFAGALIVGTAGYFGADWVADFIDEN